MHLARVLIENLRAIERFEADLSEPDGRPRRRLVILGANGSGKTTILDAVAYTFERLINMYAPYQKLGTAQLMAGDVRATGPLSRQPRYSIVELTGVLSGAEVDQSRVLAERLTRGVWDPRLLDAQELMKGTIGLTIGDLTRRRLGAEPKDWLRKVQEVLQWARPPCLLLPPNRGTLKSRVNLGLHEVTEPDPRHGCLAKGSRRFAPLAARIALASLGAKDSESSAGIDRMWKVLDKYLPEMPKLASAEGLALRFENRDGSVVPLGALSDGERAILLLFGEIAMRAPEHGVVLIDEVEQHLHPRWQRAVLEALPALVPTAQFIFTTQSPYVAASAPDDVIEVGDWKRHGE